MADTEEIDSSNLKGQVGTAFIQLVASVAGYSYSVPSMDLDSVDVQISSRAQGKPALAFQVKCTSRDTGDESSLSFALSAKNYDDLRGDSLVPRLLLVVLVPIEQEKWLRHNHRATVFSRCAYWYSLLGEPPLAGKSTVTVRIPRENLVTVATLQKLMEDRGLKRGEPS